MDAIFEQARSLWEQAAEIWLSGGWAMIAIAVVAFVMFGVGLNILLKLRDTGFRSVPEASWRRWIHQSKERQGPVGELLQGTDSARTLDEVGEHFARWRMTNLQPFERDLRVMKVCVSAAPLVGLLGTVTGMLTTFSALSSGAGGSKTMGMVAKGISEALITTETGLVVALPGLFFLAHLNRSYERYKAFLAHVESACTQSLHRDMRDGERRAIRRVAKERVAEALYRRLRRQKTAVVS